MRVKRDEKSSRFLKLKQKHNPTAVPAGSINHLQHANSLFVAFMCSFFPPASHSSHCEDFNCAETFLGWRKGTLLFSFSDDSSLESSVVCLSKIGLNEFKREQVLQ